MIRKLVVFVAAFFVTTNVLSSNAEAQDFQVPVTSEFIEFSLCLLYTSPSPRD